MENTLKACPFCGNEYLSTVKVLTKAHDNEEYKYYIDCVLCCRGPYSKSEETAINLWNKRI